MPVALLADLYELNPPSEMVDDRLITVGVPPFRREVVLPAGDQDPIPISHPAFSSGRRKSAFLLRQMNVALEQAERNGDAQLLLQELRVSVDEVIRPLIAFVNQGVVHVQRLDAGRSVPQFGDPRIVLPDRVGGSADVRLEFAGVGGVEVSHRGAEHDNVARALKRPENQLSHED